MPSPVTVLRLTASLSLTATLHVAVVSLRAQATRPTDPVVPIHFEVASVRPNRSLEGPRFMLRQPGGRFTATNVPLRDLIQFAYLATPLTVIGGPGWIDLEQFDIVAKFEGDPPPVIPGTEPDPMQLALRTLLADRFRLKLHRETRQVDAYALVMAKSNRMPGPALKRSRQDCSPEALRAAIGRGPQPPPTGAPLACGATFGVTGMRVGGMPMEVILGPLGNLTGRSVVDRTGLTGTWDFAIDFAPSSGTGTTDTAPATDAPSLFTALQEQLGLRLESTKAAVEVLVIDGIERPTPD